MKSMLTVMAAAVFMSAAGAYAQGCCCGAVTGAPDQKAVSPAKNPAACPMNATQCPMKAAKPQATCPVMGGKISKTVYADYNGKRVYFCCAGCVATFNADPEKYVKKLTAAGVKLEDVPAVK